MRLFPTLLLAAFLSLACAGICNAAKAGVAKPLPALTAASAPARPAITVRATANVSDTYFTLGEIADIKCADKDLAARLAAAPMGRAPLPGMPRPLTTGDISLKLRQAGIDPATVTLSGATTVLVTSAGDGGSLSTTTNATSPSDSAQPAQDNTVLVHAGDAVNLIYSDGTITITARAVAIQNGAQGQTIMLRRDGVAHTLQGTVLDSQTVQLED